MGLPASSSTSPRASLWAQASRLTALLILAAAALDEDADAAAAWRAVRRDAKLHRSPNAGWPEAAIAVNGTARAYPVRALAYHHIVNDTLGGVPLVGTY